MSTVSPEMKSGRSGEGDHEEPDGQQDQVADFFYSLYESDFIIHVARSRLQLWNIHSFAIFNQAKFEYFRYAYSYVASYVL